LEFRPRFHLAIPVDDLESARQFYGDMLSCPEGRSSEEWVDFDFYGHQLVVHLDRHNQSVEARNLVDGHQVPVRHFGLLLDWAEWERLGEKLKQRQYKFLIEPTVRFKGRAGEQGTFFVQDPSGNALEFKSFKNEKQIFAKG